MKASKMMGEQSRWWLGGMLCLALLLSAPVFAQSDDEDESEADSGEGKLQEEIFVLGTRVQARRNQDSPVPVDTVSSEIILQSGSPDVGRSLSTSLPSFNYSSASIADGTDSLLPATLRGLGPDQLLVMLNGKRRHNTALLHVNGSVGRGTAGVDMNAIPGIALERVEVLRDVASALYGSDAIAGVMNWRLKTTSPTILTVHSGGYSEGDGAATRLSFAHGEEFSKGSLFIALESREQGRTNRSGLMGAQNYDAKDLSVMDTNSTQYVDQTSAEYLAYADYLTANSTSTSDGCDEMFNVLCDDREFTLGRQTFRLGDPDTSQVSGVINFLWQFGASGELYMNTTWSQRDNESGGYYRQANDSERNVPEIYPDGFLPLIQSDIDDTSLTAGFRHIVGDWRLDYSYSYGKNTYDFTVVNSLNASLGVASPTSAYSGGPRFSMATWNVDASYFVNDWITLAVGAEFRTETYQLQAGDFTSWAKGPEDDGVTIKEEYEVAADADPDAFFSIQVFPGFPPKVEKSESRDNLAAYGEVGFDLGQAQISVAARMENYSDFGTALIWRGAVLWDLNHELSLRASVGTGFRAPSLHQLHYETEAISAVAGVLTQTTTVANDDPFVQALGVGALEEETTENLSLGVIWEPSESFSLTLDYYAIDIDNRIVYSALIRKENIEAKNPTSDLLEVFEEYKTDAAQLFLNLAATETRGMDVIASWQVSYDWTLKLAANVTETSLLGGIVVPGALSADITEEQIFAESDRHIIEKWQPSSRLILSADWKLDAWSAGGSIQYFGSYEASIDSDDGLKTQEHGNVALLNLRASYSWAEQLTLALGGNNVLDTYPDESKISSALSGTIKDIVDSPFGPFKYNSGTAPYGFNGAYFYAELAYKF